MKLLEKFRHDTSGSVLILSAVAFTVLIMFSGVAIDYARVASFKTRLQKASDATILMVANRVIDLKPIDSDEAKTYLHGNLNVESNESLLTTELHTSGNSVSMHATGRIPMTVMRIFGFDYWDIETASEATWGAEKLEIVISLDASSSMAGSRITAARTAVLEFLNNLYTFAGTNPRMKDAKVGVVIWDHVGRVPKPATPPAWLTLGTVNAQYVITVPNYDAWNGCLAYQNASTAPTPLVGMHCKLSFSSLTDVLPESLPLRSIKPSAAFTYMYDYVNDNYQYRFNTNNAVGMQMSIAALTPGSNHLMASQEELADFEDANTKKYIIHMTDGENNFSNDNDRFKTLCNDARLKKITVFTILMINGNQTLLEDCATQAGGKFYKVTQASEISQVFKDIFVVVSSLRLSK